MAQCCLRFQLNFPLGILTTSQKKRISAGTISIEQERASSRYYDKTINLYELRSQSIS